MSEGIDRPVAAARPHAGRDGATAGDVTAGGSAGAHIPTRRTGRVFAGVLLALILLANAAALTQVWLVNAGLETPRAEADLQGHYARIERLLHAGTPMELAQTGTLGRLENELGGAIGDLQQLDGLLPLAGAWPVGPTATEHHLFQLALDTAQAAKDIATAVPILMPPLRRVEYSLVHADAGTAVMGYGSALTIGTIHQGQYYLDTARVFVQEAQQQRSRLTWTAVDRLHSAQANAFLSEYDGFAASLANNLELASSLLDWSPGALGVLQPDHFLLVVLDPTTLRPGGGVITDYADVQTDGGALVSGIDLRSARSLVCPVTQCGEQSPSSAYAWFPLNQGQFGLRDANLDPDFPSASGLMRSMYQAATGQSVDGVIAVTPVVYASLLDLAGPLTLPGSQLSVTAANVAELLAREHAAPSVPSATPDIEAQLTQAILARLPQLSPSVQDRIGSALLADAATKDLTFFATSTRVEAQLARLAMAGDVAAPSGDSLLVVDTNDGVASVNQFVTESFADRVTLDGGGGASHDLRITYTYTPPAVATGMVRAPSEPYQDFVRIIVPSSADPPNVTGPCVASRVAQTGRVATGCQLELAPGRSITLRASWHVPAVVERARGVPTYALLVQRQSGALDDVAVTVQPPGGAGPVGAIGPASLVGGAALWRASPLLRDTTVGVTLG